MAMGPATTRATGSEALQNGKALKDTSFEKCVASKGLPGAFFWMCGK
jgi:hypothetical protein